MAESLSIVEVFQNAWGKHLIQFRDWITPDTQAIAHWKSRPIEQAIAACRSRMIDDTMEMWAAWRKNKNDSRAQGASAFLPVMLTAFESVPTSPSVRDMRAMPDWEKVILPNDTQNRKVQIRTTAMTVRAQIVVFAPTPHDIAWFAAQFCSFIQREDTRYLNLRMNLGNGLYDDWPLTLLENTLTASTVPLEEKNLYACRIDLQLSGLIPQVVGLGGINDTTTDVANRPTAAELQAVVIEADIDSEDLNVRWIANPDDTNTLVNLDDTP